MKAVVLHEYGGPDKLKWETMPDPMPGNGDVVLRVSAASVNPVDYKMRSGAAKERFPVQFPGILGRDVAGVVRTVGTDVVNFSAGDKVFALAHETYAELCVIRGTELARVPQGMEITHAAALPLVLLTGDQLARLGLKVESGQTVLVAGALGGVGRTTVFVCKQAGARVLAGVRKKQLEEARSLGADEVIALDDDEAMAGLGLLDGVADAVGGKTADMLLGKVKQGGIFASVLGPPAAAAHHPTVQIAPVMCTPDPDRLVVLAEAVRDGKLSIPIDRMVPMTEAGEAQAAAEKGGIGKIVLVA